MGTGGGDIIDYTHSAGLWTMTEPPHQRTAPDVLKTKQNRKHRAVGPGTWV